MRRVLVTLMLLPGCYLFEKEQEEGWGNGLSGGVEPDDAPDGPTWGNGGGDPGDTDDTDVVDTFIPPDDAVDWEREISVQLTADDDWELYINGEQYEGPNHADWATADRVVKRFAGYRHVVGVHIGDTSGANAALMAVVHVTNELYAMTGDEAWVVTATPPGPGWATRAFDDSGWSPAFTCPRAEVAGYTGLDPSLAGFGARWIGAEPTCAGTGELWFRLVVE